MTHPGLCCFLSTERIDEMNIKARIATSKCRPTTSEVAWVFLGDNAAVKPTGCSVSGISRVDGTCECVNKMITSLHSTRTSR